MREAVTLTTETKKLKSGPVEYWVLRWFARDGRYCSKSLGRVDKVGLKEAKRKQRQILNDFDAAPGRRDAGRAMGLKKYLDTFFERHSYELAAKTITSYKTTARYAVEYFGEHEPISDITRDGAAGFKAALSAGKLKAAMIRKAAVNTITLNIHMRNIKAIFGRAVQTDMLLYNPFDRVVTNVKKSLDWRYIKPHEYKAVVAVATPKFALLIALCRLAGLRRNEALHLTWDNIDWDKSRLHVVGDEDWQPKGRERRTIPVCPELHAALLAAFENAPEGERRVLYDIYEENLTRDILATVTRAGLTHYRKPLHSLRKACITDWAARYPMHAVQQWAGHASITTTRDYYLKVQESDYQRAAAEGFWTNNIVTESATEKAGNADTGQKQDTKDEAQTHE